MAHFSQSSQPSSSSNGSLHYQLQVSTAAPEYVEWVDRIYSNTENTWVTVPSTNKNIYRDTDKGLAFIARREFSTEGVYLHTALVIESKHLGEVITIVLRDVDGIGPIGKSSEVETHILYHYLDSFRDFDISNYSESSLMSTMDDREIQLCVKHLDTLISFLEYEHSTDQTLAEQLLSYSPPHITFDLLWFIFKPNTLIMEKGNRARPGDFLYQTRYAQKSSEFKLNSKFIRFDGELLGFLSAGPLEISRFKGSKPVAQLRYLPFKFGPSYMAIRSILKERGRKFVDFCRLGKKYVHYVGIVETISKGPDTSNDTWDSMIFSKVKVNGRVMLDPKTYFMENNNIIPSVNDLGSRLDSLAEFGVSSHNDWYSKVNDTHLLLCPGEILGFIIEHKVWGYIAIDYIADIDWKRNKLEDVVLDKTTKDIIKGLVDENKSDGRATQLLDNIIPEKGTGLIMLFTGPPGVGKTLTAEAVAEVTHRPLYYISANDLDSDPGRLDKRLAEILQRGCLWGAVLLVDEADVFLEQRTSFDVKRNSLVSIFLRQLEYYTGIIILTSNRADTFNKALESRVHFRLRFRELDRNSRLQIWKYFLKDTPQALSESEFSRVADLRFNGRMIKYSVSLGRSLAKGRSQNFSYNHIQQVLAFVDPMQLTEPASLADELYYASPIDPAISTAAATPATEEFATPRNLAREVVHREGRTPRGPGPDMDMIYGIMAPKTSLNGLDSMR